MKDHFIGALVGTFVGDALGMPVEGWSHQTIHSIYGQVREMLNARLGAGTYTDDTQMMIALTESLITCRKFKGDDLARRFLANFDPNRGYGAGTIQALHRLKEGISWKQAGLNIYGEGSYGNGSAMRVAPIGVLYHDDLTSLRAVAENSSLITHAHPLGKAGAVLQARAVALALTYSLEKKLDSQAFLSQLKSFLKPAEEIYLSLLESVQDLLTKSVTAKKVIDVLGHDSRATHSVPTAIYAFLSHPDSFEEAVIYAVGLGGDSDTIGAMTGALAGAYHGLNSIPQRWLQCLEESPKGLSYVINLGEKLYTLWKERHQRIKNQ